MKIDLISDTHLEFRKYPIKYMDNCINWDHTGDILIIAGDFYTFKTEEKREEFLRILDYLKRFHYTDIYYLCGNHEYYGSTLEEVDSFLSNIDLKWFHYLEKKTAPIILKNGIKLIGRTLWSGLNNNNPIIANKVRNGISDFYHIKDFTTDKMVNIYLESKKFLEDNTDENTIVVTHFSPTDFEGNPIYRGSPLDPYFNVGLENFIYSKKPKYYLHGHVHDFKDTTLDQTRIICNPLDYNPKENYKPFQLEI